jgi:hypothetical protein
MRERETLPTSLNLFQTGEIFSAQSGGDSSNPVEI